MPKLIAGSDISTPSRKFVDKFKEVFGIDLLDGHWYDRLFSLQRGQYTFQTLKFDRWLSKNDSDYDFDEATYRGEPISMNGYVEAKYGKLGVDMLDYLEQSNDKFESEFEGY